MSALWKTQHQTDVNAKKTIWISVQGIKKSSTDISHENIIMFMLGISFTHMYDRSKRFRATNNLETGIRQFTNRDSSLQQIIPF